MGVLDGKTEQDAVSDFDPAMFDLNKSVERLNASVVGISDVILDRYVRFWPPSRSLI